MFFLFACLPACLLHDLMIDLILQEFWKTQRSKGIGSAPSNNPSESLERQTMLSLLTPILPASTPSREEVMNAHLELVRMAMGRESYDDVIEHIGFVAKYLNAHSYRDEVSVGNFSRPFHCYM